MAIKDGTEFCTSFNNMSQHSKDKLPTPGLKRKLKTHTIETKFQAITDGPHRKKMRTAAYKVTEEAVLQWFKTARDQNVPVFGPLFITKAQ